MFIASVYVKIAVTYYTGVGKNEDYLNRTNSKSKHDENQFK